MNSPENNTNYFLQNGGEMGQLIRNKDWSKTPIGTPENWPTSLKSMVSMILNNPFAMMIVWGSDYTQIYNNGYLPILGKNKHPKVLGENFKESFAENWQVLGPLFMQAKNGKAVGFNDFILPLNKNGILEECLFDFSYSPIYQENGIIGGVLITVVETTEKNKFTTNLKLNNKRYFESIMQAPVAMCFLRSENFIVDIANKFMLALLGESEDALLKKPLFEGLKNVKNQGLEEILKHVYESGERFEAFEKPFNLLRNGKLETVYVNFAQEAFREEDGKISGIVVIATEVTSQVLSRQKILENDQKIKSIVENATFPVALYKGENFEIEFANDALKKTWKKGNNLTGKYLEEVMPELKNHFILSQLKNVYKTRKPYFGKNIKMQISNNGILENFYFNFNCTPILNNDGSIYGVMNTSTNVTDLNIAKKKAEAADKRFRNTVKQAPIGITILRGENFMVEMANDIYLSLIDKKEEDFIGKPIFYSMPEIKNEIEGLLLNVLETGNPYHGIEYPLAVNRFGKSELSYFDFLYAPLRENNGEINGIIVTATEVTESVKSKHFIAESEKQFRTMVMNSPIPMTILKGKNYKIEMANKAMLDTIWNKKEKEVIGKSLLKVFPELHDQKYANLLHKVFTEGKLHREYESIAYIDSGNGLKKFYLDFEYAPLQDTEGKTSGIMITVNDVTLKVEARLKIEASEKKFRLLADSMPQYIWTADIEGNINYYNKSVFEFTGLNFEQIMQAGWLDIVHPDDREINTKNWINSIQTGQNFLVEHRFRKFDGTYRWQLSRAIPQLDEDGNIIMWVGTSTDIQDQKDFTNELEKQVKERTKELELLNKTLKKSEERYHLMVEEVQDYAVLYINPLGIIENWNKGAEKIKGYKPEEIIGKSFSVFYTKQDILEKLPTKLLKIAEDTGRAAQEGWRVRKDKSVFWANVVITSVRNDAGIIIGYSKFTHDLTQKKNAEDALKNYSEELLEKNDTLEKMNKELQSFAYISSHDLQEPLRKIQTFATQIMTNELDTLSLNAIDKFKRMQSAANRMQMLIEDLLAYSRTNIKEKKLELVNLSTIIEDVKEDLYEEIIRKNATVQVLEVCEVRVINFQFRQLLYNLISNSLKFSTQNGQPIITISCKIAKGKSFDKAKLASETEYCNITVTDNGIGFEQQYGERIFEVFHRLHGKEKYIGTGIGLAIVKKIVENHNGIITATSELDKGAVFDIYFPSV